MMKSKELRKKAWASLKGNYWASLGTIIVMGLICSIGNAFVSFSQNLSETLGQTDPSVMATNALLLSVVVIGLAIVGLLISIFVESAATVGLANYFIKNTDSKPSLKEAFLGFRVKYSRNIGTLLLVGIKLVLWSFVFVIPAIIKSFEYEMIPYILADDAEISSKEAFKKAKEMMKGNKWRLFKLNFSFIGWILLSFLTLGIGVFFLLPYISAANAEFYVELKNK